MVEYNKDTNDYTITKVSRDALKLIYSGLWIKQLKLEKKLCKTSVHDDKNGWDKFVKLRRKIELCERLRFNSSVNLDRGKKGWSLK